MNKKNKICWTQTDPATKQFGRQISEYVFQFVQEDIDQREIDIRKFSEQSIQSCIMSYGYTLNEPKGNDVNVYELYGSEANWIIAECLFEMEINENVQTNG